MSFSSDVKTEICRQFSEAGCCKKAECYGFLLFGKSFLSGVSVNTEHGAAAHRMAELTAEATGCIVQIKTSLSQKDGRSNYSLSIDRGQTDKLLFCFGHSAKEINRRINWANLENDCCKAAFLRGVFLSCGTVTNPQKDYHLEFIVPYMNLSRDLVRMIEDIQELEIQPSVVKRKGSYVVYMKESEQIADLLTYIGAPAAAMELMQVKMVKEVRNYVNRKTNFETANIDKTVSASAKQVEAIQRILDTVGLEALPEELQELASLRIEHPEMSLRELGESLMEPISRSGVNHRLKRILEFSDHLGTYK